ncbi:MAG: LapA family protein [Pseudohongiellaceae bacterium]|nr:LapA family protein [Pseudohongiellaceae bacterium]
MQRLFRIFMWLFLLCVFLFSVIFSFFNTQAIVVSLGYFDTPALPLAVWILGAFAVGGLLGLVLTNLSLRGFRHKRELTKVQAKLQAANMRIAQLEKEQAALQTKDK